MSSFFKLGYCSAVLVVPVMLLFDFGPLGDPAISSSVNMQATPALCDRATPAPPTGCIPVKYINTDGSSPDLPNWQAD